jgi:fibronectin-binding autotransporter adhesin
MKPRRLFFLPARALALATLSLSFSANLIAAPIYWEGATNASWNDPANWSMDPGAGTPDPATVPGAGDVAHFSLTGQGSARTVNLMTDQMAQGIITQNLTGIVTLRGGNGVPVSLTLGSGGIEHLTGGLTIGTSAEDKVNIVLAATQRWNSATTGSGASAIMVANDVSAAAGNHELTLGGSNLGSYIGGAISDGSGTISIVKEGDGVWELRGANTYSGTTQVKAGTLRLANYAAASTNSSISVLGGATIALRIGGSGGMTTEEVDTVRSSITYASSAANLGLDVGASVTYGGNLSGNHGLVKTGNQTLTLSGDNSHTGETVVSSGYLAYLDPGAVSANSQITAKAGAGVYFSADPTGFTLSELETLRNSITYEDKTAVFGVSTTASSFAYDTAMAGEHGFLKAGNNVLTFGGTGSNTYTGPTRIAGGTLALNKTGGATAIPGSIIQSAGSLRLDAADQIIDTATITASGNSTIRFSAKSETIAEVTLSGNADLNTGNSTTSATSIVNLGTVSLSDSARITVNSGGKIIASSLSLTGTVETNNTSGNILIGGSHASAVSGIEIGGGGLTMQNRTIQVNGTTTSAHLGSRISLGGTFTGSGENLIKINAANNRLIELAMGTGERTFNITGGNTQIDINVAGETLVKTGAGSLALAGNNIYTGLTKVDNGIIRVLSNNALGGAAQGTEVASGGQVRLENNVTVTGESLRIAGTTNSGISAGLMNFGGNNVWTGRIDVDLQVGAASIQNARISMSGGTLDLRGEISISDNGATSNSGFGLVLTGNDGTGTVSGVIRGVGLNQNLIKNGSSTWVLSGTNTFTGLTRVDDGVLSVDSIARNLGAPNSGSTLINLGENAASGTLRYTGTADETTSRGLRLRSNSTGGGTVEQAGTGALVITGQINGTSTTSDKTLTLSGSTTGTGELTGAFADTDGTGRTNLLKSGTGTWTLSGTAKNFQGSTTVTGGLLNVSTSLTQSTSINVTEGTFHIAADHVIKDDATVTLGGGAILQVSGFTDAAGVLIVTGNSQLNLSGSINSLTFLNSSSADWTGGLLSISGWSGLAAGDDEISFDAAGLTGSQLSAIQFINPQGFAEGIYSAKFLGNQLIPDALIPEPSTTLTFLSGAACLLIRRRRK